MSSVANWAYTAIATIWRQAGTDEWNKSTFHKPELFLCDYGGDAKRVMSGVSAEVVIKNIFWTEFSQAKQGDYVLLGEHTEPDPLKANADEIKHIIRYADTFERIADDYALVTGV